MEVIVTRIFKGETFTIGELTVNGEYICDTLEDKVRPLPDMCPYTSKNESCNCKEKVYGKTAIPNGTYELKLTYSNKFKKILPEILNVPHFLGIRIHTGNSASDSEGCILVGKWDGVTVNWISNSRDCFTKLMDLLNNVSDKESITITIKDA